MKQNAASAGLALREQVQMVRKKIYDNIWQTIGDTPLVRIPKLSKEYGVKADILLKLEFFNPLSSVKDRLAMALIEDGEQSGKINKDTVIIEATSGNTGIGLAFICASKGYKLILTMPESMSSERRKMLRIFGAELILTPAEGGMKAAMDKAFELAKEYPNSYIPNQFSNPANVAIHKNTTAEEIWRDTEGNIDALIAGVGTGGTFTGIAKALKEKKKDFKAIAVEPAESAVLSGEEARSHKIPGIGAGFIPELLNIKLIDEIFKVKSEDAHYMCRYIAKREGIAVGISSGAAIHCALEIGKRSNMTDKTIVVIIPSTAERYLSLPIFKDL